MARLTIEGGAEAREVELNDLCRIGRDAGNEITLDDPGSSRRHCRIVRDGDGWLLEDLKSANGTFKNGERIDKSRLEDGDEVNIGATTLRFHAAQEIRLEDPAAAPTHVLDAAATDRGEPTPFSAVFTAGPMQGERRAVTSTRFTLGRRPTNAVELKDPKVSGVHAELVLEDGRPVLRDLGSTNGTFLEGKRVEEVVLSHGDRVQLGDTEFVLVDDRQPAPSFSGAETAVNLEQTMIAVPDVKVVRDVGRTRSPLAIIGLLVIIAGIGVAGFYLVRQRSGSGAEIAPAPAGAGNLLGPRWSFESGDQAAAGDDDVAPTDAWKFQDDSLASFRIDTAAVSGAQSLAADTSEGSAVASLRQGIRVDSRKRYSIMAQVRCDGGAEGLLAAAFRSDESDAFRVDVGLGGSASEDWQSIGDDVVPPTGATHLLVQLIAAPTGPTAGTVMFDDVHVIETGSGTPVIQEVSGFEFESSGRTLLMRRGPDLLRIAGLVFGTADACHDSDRFLSTREGSGDVSLSGGESVRTTVSFSTESGLATRRYEWTTPPSLESVTLPVWLLPALAEEPVRVMRENRLEPFRNSFQVDSASGLVLGSGATRARLTFEPPVAIEGVRESDRFLLFIRPKVAEGKLTLRIQLDFVQERTQALDLLGDARKAETAGRLGEALVILDRIQNEFPFDDRVLAEAEGRRQKIAKERQRLEGRLADAIARAEFLFSVTAYDEAQSEAKQLVAAFAGTAEADRFQARAAELVAQRESLQRDAEQRHANALLERLETALAQDPPWTLAAHQIVEELARRYPWSDAARRAKDLVK